MTGGLRERRGKPSPEPGAYGLQVRQQQCQREGISVDTFLPPGSTAEGHFRWEVLPNVLVCTWGFKLRTVSCSVMKPLQIMCTKKKKRRKRKNGEEKETQSCLCKKAKCRVSRELLHPMPCSGPVNVFSESHKRNKTLSKFKTHFIPLQEHILP